MNFAEQVAPLIEKYETECESAATELEHQDNRLRRESLSEAVEAYQLVLRRLRSIHDEQSIKETREYLRAQMEGIQPAIKGQIILNALSLLNTNVRESSASQAGGGSKEEAIQLIRDAITPEDRETLKTELSKTDLEEWAAQHHMFFGMAIRNKLRQGGFDASMLGATSLDDAWPKIVYRAVFGGS